MTLQQLIVEPVLCIDSQRYLGFFCARDLSPYIIFHRLSLLFGLPACAGTALDDTNENDIRLAEVLSSEREVLRQSLREGQEELVKLEQERAALAIRYNSLVDKYTQDGLGPVLKGMFCCGGGQIVVGG